MFCKRPQRPALFAFLVLSFGSLAATFAPRLLTYDPAGQAVMRLAILVRLCFLLAPFPWRSTGFCSSAKRQRETFRAVQPAFSFVLRWLAVVLFF